MTGFFQGLINKGNTKKTTGPPGTSAPDKKPISASKPLPQLDSSLVGNNGLPNGGSS
jgi:hypothetical protein